jgi:hypothetical protein
MKTKTRNQNQAAHEIHVYGAAAVLKIPTCGICDGEIVWIGDDWYHARASEYDHCARAGQGHTLYVADYNAEAEIAA